MHTISFQQRFVAFQQGSVAFQMERVSFERTGKYLSPLKLKVSLFNRYCLFPAQKCLFSEEICLFSAEKCRFSNIMGFFVTGKCLSLFDCKRSLSTESVFFSTEICLFSTKFVLVWQRSVNFEKKKDFAFQQRHLFDQKKHFYAKEMSIFKRKVSFQKRRLFESVYEIFDGWSTLIILCKRIIRKNPKQKKNCFHSEGAGETHAWMGNQKDRL